MGEKMQFTELDQYLFGQGTHYDIYKKLGAHPTTQHRKKGVYFAVWAPNARYVSVIGDFNNWDNQANPMNRVGEIGVYEIFVPGAKVGDLYKFFIVGYHGEELYKADPYANEAELRPGTASRITDITDYKWKDTTWMKKRPEFDEKREPMAIYEVHLGSWKKHPAENEDDPGFYNYREFAHELAAYVKEMGYTHVELMGIAEHPFDGSWGYQVTGYYGVTSRYGTPEDFNYMINELHKAGISVILDWVPAHFPRDEHGLAMFDGTHIYDHEDPRKGSQPDWGTLLFNYGKPEVQSFLISSAMFFADIYHVDGIRIDAVSAMLYLDFGKQEGEYVPNEDGTNINYEAVDFLHNLNEALRTTYEGFLTIAEESTAYPKVTSDIDDPDGLGFVYKWNMGYMHDSLYYMELDPLYRKDNHGAIIFSMDYAYSENYILPYSHDEVVHGKGSMINKMYGAYDEKFASLRTLYGFTIAHPGKKLLFMGGEFAQFVEWRDKEQLDWFLIDQYEMHDSFHEYVAKLNEIYKAHPAFYELDQDPAGFEWCLQRDADHSVVAFIRKSKRGRGRKQEQILCVCNFTPMEWDKYQIPLPKKSKLTKILDSSELNFGGDGDVSETKVSTKRVKVPSEGKATYQQCAQISLKPLSVVYYKIEEVETKPRKTAAKKTEAAKKVTKEVVEETKAEETKTVKSTTKVVAKTKKAEPIKKAVQEKKPAPKSETSKKEDTKETTETVTKEKEQPKKKARKTRRTNKNKNQGVK